MPRSLSFLRPLVTLRPNDSHTAAPPPIVPFGPKPMPSIFDLLEREQRAMDEAVADVLKRKNHGALLAGLNCLKFSPENIEAILDIVEVTAGVVSVVGAVVSAVETAQKLMTLLGLGSEKGEDVLNAIEALQQKVDDIYQYLLDKEKKGLYEKYQRWINIVNTTRGLSDDVTASPVPNSIERLGRRADELDLMLQDMLSEPNGIITFSSVGFSHSQSTKGWAVNWPWVTGTPFLQYANNNPVPEIKELSPIWDPGHYLPLLATTIRLRLHVASTLEPLYCSTGYNRRLVQMIVPALQAFITRWKNSIMVADPASCVLADGTLPVYSHLLSKTGLPWPGILIGAACPVTGVSSLQMYNEFAMTRDTKGGLPFGIGATGDPPYKVRAVHPTEALSGAYALHPSLVDQVQQACGVNQFEALLQALDATVNSPASSEAVRLVAYKTGVPDPRGPAGGQVFVPVQTRIDLGALKRWARNSAKTYPATRYYLGTERTVVIRMARRALVSQIRLGYKLRINKEEFDLITWDTKPPPETLEANIKWFPEATIERDVQLETKVYDCIQSRSFNAKEEAKFEEDGDAPSGAQRLLLNEHKRVVKFHVRIEFAPRVNNENHAYLGEVRLTIRPHDIVEQPDAYLLDLTMLEIHVEPRDPMLSLENRDDVRGTVETLVDVGSVHVIPSYLVVGDEFFDDYHDAWQRMLKVKIQTALGDRFSPSEVEIPTSPDPNPKFLTIQMASNIEVDVQRFTLAERDPEFAAEVKKSLASHLAQPSGLASGLSARATGA